MNRRNWSRTSANSVLQSGPGDIAKESWPACSHGANPTTSQASHASSVWGNWRSAPRPAILQSVNLFMMIREEHADIISHPILASPPISIRVLAPAQLLPPEIQAEIYHHLRSTSTSITQRQGVAAHFLRVCRAFCHAQKLAGVSEVALSGGAGLECFTRWGSSAVSSVRSLEVIGTEDDLELMEHLIRRVKNWLLSCR